MTIGHFLVELIVEIIAAIAVAGFVWFKIKINQRKLDKTQKKFDLDSLNGDQIDEVLLINSLSDLENDTYKARYDLANIVLMQDKKTKLYDIVVKNRYGAEGKIR